MADQRMTESEREEFLAGLHVGVLGIERADGPPLVLPV
jgi:nitroimidazol reductase NimA-like FMN-containing flavoprotein (pyridoxamine 5'-phosphate oxidase superfamily)